MMLISCGSSPGHGRVADKIGASVSQISGDGQTAAVGRRIQVPGTFNLRDIGGYPAASGRTTRWRRLLRSDALHLVDASGAIALADLGLRTVIDLRTDGEAAIAPDPFLGSTTQAMRISLLGRDLLGLPPELAGIYRYMIGERGDAVTAAVRVLCDASSLPALVHCHAGKDRTGILIGLVLAVLGVPDEVIADDYALSASYLNPQTTAAIGHLHPSSKFDEALAADLLASPPALILDVLAQARAAGGDIDGYLVSHGASRAELDSLREELTS
jgi:protein-tyrosine phosphatase